MNVPTTVRAVIRYLTGTRLSNRRLKPMIKSGRTQLRKLERSLQACGVTTFRRKPTRKNVSQALRRGDAVLLGTADQSFRLVKSRWSLRYLFAPRATICVVAGVR